eukprot:TRINITY_DN135_c2_g1_i2.p1 TRINITY_DN135_c2_g1~~TRINITY_DN135_c2_g1_i2.p1  ORF type:complete len:540 (+),score=132.74 TRINITY_DN135_c2_g1_i2:1144-2763(+)
MKAATDFLLANKRPAWTPIQRYAEGAESALFKSKFEAWMDVPTAKNMAAYGDGSGENVARAATQEAIDIAKMHQRKKVEQERMVDDGSGKVEIWRIEDFKKVPWDKPGQFYSGDSFLVLYTYGVRGHELHLIYFWQGRHSSIDEKASVALFAKDLDDQFGGEPVQVRVVQGKEPNHFLQLFRGKMVVHEGGVMSGFRNAGADGPASPLSSGGSPVMGSPSAAAGGGAGGGGGGTKSLALFHIKGTNPLNTRAVEVDCKVGSLNSGDAFVLLTHKKCWIWNGRGCNADEKKNSQTIANELKEHREVFVISEGDEPGEFWKGLGHNPALGPPEYSALPELESEAREARLFHCSNASGTFKVEEIFHFGQDDLEADDVYLLDTFNEVFIWVGAGSNQLERRMALQTAFDYIKSAGDGRTATTTPMFQINAGFEPPNFTCHFLGWDSVLAKSKEDKYVAKLREAGKVFGGITLAKEALDEYSRRYTYQQLLDKASLPPTVDQFCLEEYLEDAEFVQIFGVSREEFRKMPRWKKDALRSKHNLF